MFWASFLLAGLVFVLQPGSAWAHHAFAADYSAELTGTVEGEVTEVFFQNPHAHYYVEVTNEDGTTEMWDAQTMNLGILTRAGWTKETLQPGDRIEINGNLGRDDTRRINILSVEKADGTILHPTRAALPTVDDTGPGAIPPGAYELDENHAYISFSYSHLGLSNPQLRFAEFDAELNLSTQAMQDSTVTVTIDASSIDTSVPELDEALRGVGFLDVATYPEITFQSTAYEPISDETGTLSGNLTVKDVTVPVTLEVIINNANVALMTNRPTIGISATGIVARSAFGLTDMLPMVGDELSLKIQAEFSQPR